MGEQTDTCTLSSVVKTYLIWSSLRSVRVEPRLWCALYYSKLSSNCKL